MSRDLANLEYVPITSTVDYEEQYHIMDDAVPHHEGPETNSNVVDRDS
jgi:hypothetical protein